MSEYLPYLIGAGLLIIANRFGITLPFQIPTPNTPAPTPNTQPPAIVSQVGADRELTTALAWCQQASVGAVRIDPEDRIALTALGRSVANLTGEATPK